MSLELPADLVQTLDIQVRLRQQQLRQLAIYYTKQYPAPKTVVAYGLQETAKLETITAILKVRDIPHVTVRSRECLNQRQLLSRIFTAFAQTAEHDQDLDKFDRVDSINSLFGNLKKLLSKQDEQVVLIIDAIDEQTGGTHTLLPALARLGDIIPCLSVIFTSNSSRPLPLHHSGVPHIYFPPYTRAEAVQIVLHTSPDLLPDDIDQHSDKLSTDKIKQIYAQFVTVAYDTLSANTTTSISRFRETCTVLWPRFIWPAISELSAKQPWTFAKLISRNRPLFQAAGENALQDTLLISTSEPRTFDELQQAQRQQQQQQHEIKQNTTAKQPLLKHFPTLLLLSAYLASHTPQKQDIILFSRLSSSSTKKRKYLHRSRAGGISKTPTKSPSKSKSASDQQDGPQAQTPTRTNKESGEARTPKKERADRSMRAILERTSHIARPFTLERLIAILRAVHPEGVKRGTGDRVYGELAELERLRLVVRCGEGEGEERWRCVCSRRVVVEWGGFWGVGLEGWEVVD